ncbi:MAG: hypothetical protein FJ271_18915 [Planctomycetes bacterium]|nr:hypothetical protein [Planctomycetota bacterium]
MTRRVLLVSLALLCLAANRPDGSSATTPNTPVAKAKASRPSASDDMVDISGYYVCKGKEASGKTYSGVTVITKRNDVYLIQWTVGAGAAFSGVAIRQGSTLAASWALPADKAGVIRGVNLYRIEAGPKLVGRWATAPGTGQAQFETLTFLKDLDDEED